MIVKMNNDHLTCTGTKATYLTKTLKVVNYYLKYPSMLKQYGTSLDLAKES